ncbi:unnamed protein product [Hydatigera taeniaeformis]|uniref:Integrin alpha second immunoglobulin-like domain-containing protein n=1 Tax=Hydatigena taeniaeformis TaxID=6205 RepID=A0A3P7FD52_HYDTA|nr:unnamed protein product [Hydatigera taeniaeformis]
MPISFRVIVGAPLDDKSGSIFWCTYDRSQCRRVNFDIHKSARFSYAVLNNELFGFSLSTLPKEQNRLAIACSPRLSYEVTGKLFVTGGCFAFNNALDNSSFLGASTCLNIPEASRSIDLRFCLDGASAAYVHNSNTDIIVSGSPYYQFAKGIGLVNNVTEFNPVRKTDIAHVGDYSLLGVPQTENNEGSGFVTLNVIERSTNQIVIPQAKVLHGNRFGSRFGHALALIDLDSDGWDDLVVGAPFEQLPGVNAAPQQDLDIQSVHNAPVLGCIYVFWNQRRRLPSVTAFDFTSVQTIWPPTSLSSKSGFGSSITSLGDINHDGVDDFAVGAPYDEGGGAVIIYHGSKSRRINGPTQILNAAELSEAMKGFGFSLSAGGLDLDNNGYPDLAVGAPDSDTIAVFRARPVIKVKIFVLRENGLSHVRERLDSLEECTRDTQILPGYWAPRVHCMNMRVLATFTHLDRISCTQRTIPVRLLLSINPPEHWLNEEFMNTTLSNTEIPVASFFGERLLKVDDPEVRLFYQRMNKTATPPAGSDEMLPFLFLNSLTAYCRDHSAADKPLSPAELIRATPVRLAFRDVDLVDLTSPIRIGVKWLLDASSPSSSFDELKNHPISDPMENTGQAMITFGNECESRKCNPILLPQFEYSVNRDKDGPVVFVGDDEFQSIEVKATVTNRGRDPSYATSIYTSYPEELLDLSTDSHKQYQRATIVRPGLALCHFGNPLPVGRGATCLLRFKVLGQQLMEAPKNFTINSTITSSPKFPPNMLAPATDSITVKVKMRVNVSVTGEILPDAAYYSGNVTDGILINNGENKIGSTRLLIRVRVQNLRKHSLVPNSRLVIDWPYETADIITEPNGKLLFYLLEKPYITKTDLPTASNMTVVCDSRALDRLVNPYNYRVFKSLVPQPRGDPVTTAPVDPPSSHPVEYPPLKPNLEIKQMPDQGNVRRVSTTLVRYHLWIQSMRTLMLFRAAITVNYAVYRFMLSSKCYASVQCQFTFTTNSIQIELKIFNDMEPEPVYPKNMPLYIGLAVFAGLLLLAILIIILWKAKFFERKKFKQRFQRTKPPSEGPKSDTPEGRQFSISNPPPRQPSLHSPPISAYGNMNT